MFTGIIRDTGEIVERSAEGSFLRVKTASSLTDRLSVGDSVSCSGVCLTATCVEPGVFSADICRETLERTTATAWRIGDALNLEPALRAGDPLGGHLVTGHVDGVSVLLSAEDTGNGVRWELSLPPALAPFVAEKGSVCLDGISLTVNEAGRETFSVMLIPHTLAHTSLKDRRLGDGLNLEIDLVARYLRRFHDMQGEG
jgi:riboflavin synthase